MYEVEKAAVMREITDDAQVRWFINDGHEHDEIRMPVLI